MKRMVVAVLAAVLGFAGLAVWALSAPSSAAPVPSKALAAIAPGVPTQWKSVSAAGDTTCGISSKSKLFCWGYNYYGQVGNGSNDSQTLPVKIGSANWLSVRTAYYSSCGVQTDRSAWCWGYNGYGELGDGTNDGDVNTGRNVPTRVLGNQKWASFTAGYYNSCGITTGGALWCTGYDGEGSLGDGEGDTSTYSVRRIGTASNWSSVTVGYYHTCARKSTGQAFCWGDGSYGATGTGSSDDTFTPTALPGTWKSVNTVATTTCGVTTNNVSKCWGYNDYGQAGTGSAEPTYVTTPTRLSVDATAYTRVRPGFGYSCGITSTDAVKCFGNNSYGQFGDGTTDDSLTPATAAGAKTGWTQLSFGDYHACGIRNAGKLLCWGYNSYGALGDGTTNNSSTPSQVGNVGPTPTTTQFSEGRKGLARRGPAFIKH